MKHIISISLGSSQRDYHIKTIILGYPLDIQRIGTNGDDILAAILVASYDGQVDAISLHTQSPGFSLTSNAKPSPTTMRLLAMADSTPAWQGCHIRTALERWAIKCVADTHPSLVRHRHILFLQGLDSYHLIEALQPYYPTLTFADPLLDTGKAWLPALRTRAQLAAYAQTLYPLTFVTSPHTRSIRLGNLKQTKQIASLFARADVVVGDMEIFQHLAPDDLRKLTLITNAPTVQDIKDMRERGLETLITMTPSLHSEHPYVTSDVLEAMIAVMHPHTNTLNETHIFDFLAQSGWQPTIQHLNPTNKVSFAFVVHPLQTRHLLRHPRFRFARYLPERLVEWIAAYSPPLYLSRIRGIRSKATGKEVEGILLSLAATPREMMRRPPWFTYRRLLKAASWAERKGARIMGLGAFTSVVGDAGATVAHHSTIGITSGNALTVAATLETAKRAILMMGGRVDRGQAVVIGATGSIGAACARLLAMAIHDVVIVAPRPERLLALKMQIEQETPTARVVAATHADGHCDDADLIITTTSSLQGGVLNIHRLKPGAVVCDVARPPNVLPHEVATRPDVLVIESGEVRLPGTPDFGFDIGLPPGIAYACLAETALLAMEEMYNDYTVGRAIDLKRVKTVYRLMKRHGLELAEFRSFGKELTPAMIAEKRRLAEEKRKG